MARTPDEAVVRVRAEAADAGTARLLGLPWEACPPSGEGGMCGCGEPDGPPPAGTLLRLPDEMAGPRITGSPVSAGNGPKSSRACRCPRPASGTRR